MQMEAKFTFRQYLSFGKPQMASQSDELNPNQLKPSGYLIDPVFLTQMELLVVKLLKFKKGESHQISNLKDLSQNSRNPYSFVAKLNQTQKDATQCPSKASICELIDPQFFVNISKPSCPQEVKVYMFFNQNSSDQTNVPPKTTCKEEESKLANKVTNSKPLIFPSYPLVQGQAQKDVKDQARKTSYNPNEVGLHYLKGMNNNPQTSTIQVDGEKRIIVQIKRDSNKMSNTSQNVQNTQNQNFQGHSDHSHQPMPIYEGWSNPYQNGNHLSQGQNYIDQGNTQLSYPNNANLTYFPKETTHKSGMGQNFSLVQQATETSQTSQKYFSFGKNDKSSSKDYNTPFKILESPSKEESSENNESSENKKSDVISYKRANVGDPLPYQGSLLDNFNKLVSLKQQKDLEEREHFERRKIQKRKKQTRKLLLGEEDSDDQSKQQKASINPSTQNQYFMGNRERLNNLPNSSTNSGSYASQVIPLFGFGFTQNNQNPLGSNQVHYGNHLNPGPYNTGESKMSGIQSFHQPIQGNIFQNKESSIQGQQANKLVKREESGSLVNGQFPETKAVDNLSSVNSLNQFQKQPINYQNTNPTLAPQVHSNLQNPSIQSNANPFQMIPQNINSVSQFPNEYQQQINPQNHNIIQPTIRSQNLTIPTITPANFFEFLYFKELQRQRNDFNRSCVPTNEFCPKEHKLQGQRQACSQQNFDELFKEFQLLINPSQQSQNIQSNLQAQGHMPNSFDAFSQRIQAKNIYASKYFSIEWQDIIK